MPKTSLKQYHAISEDGTPIVTGSVANLYAEISRALQPVVGYDIRILRLYLPDGTIHYSRGYAVCSNKIKKRCLENYDIDLGVHPKDLFEQVITCLGAQIIQKRK